MTASGLPPLVLWSGPINASQAKGATVPGAQRHFFTCTGDGSLPPRCTEYATFQGSRILPSLLSRVGLREDMVGDIYLGAFSAGGQLWKRVLDIPEDRARIRGVMLHDAAYEIGSQKSPNFVEGYVKFGLDALKDPNKFMLMTASITPNTPRPGEYYQSGADTMRATIAEIERRSGSALTEGGTMPGATPRPSRLWSNGKNIFLAQYDEAGHMGLAANAPVFWEQVLQPWTAGAGKTTIDDGFLPVFIVVAIGAATGYLGASVLER